ncbi:MAG: 6,7-dimethyl-8-ribityllumazine synthase [Planctomycetota bacterium]|jgi:6,7-dimethyl-8-ribityllumazine synthase
MHTELKPNASAAGLRIGIAISRYHSVITEPMRDAAVKRFVDAGGGPGDLRIVSTPGTFELTAACGALAARNDIDAVVALGCVISGETTHDQYIASAVAHGLTSITVHTGVPVAFGVLTCQNMAQAEARAGGEKGNKGAEAMTAAIEAARLIDAAGRIGAWPPGDGARLSRDIRRCALQAMYQFDAGAAPTEEVRKTLDESPGSPETRENGFRLALQAWTRREEADAAVAAISPDWPTYRQPVIDRSILRLAYYEMADGGTPPKVAINEAVELAKEFSTEKSPLFINGVLDKIYKSRFRVEVAGGGAASGGGG